MALSKNCHRWGQFFNLWQQYRNTDGAPVFAGRYFGNAYPWVPGELQTLRNSAPTAAKDLRYIIPYNQPAQGRTKGKKEDGCADAEKAGKAIKAALEHFHEPEIGLLAPKAGSLFVFLCLDVNPQLESTLSPDYWMGWSETVRNFDAGTTLLPALYVPLWNTVGKNEFTAYDQNKTVKKAFQLENAPGWDSAKHRCHALATPAPWNKGVSATVKTARNASAQKIADSWPNYEELEQPDGMTAPVVLWQYRINIVLTADVGSWQRNGNGPEISSTGTPNGRYHFIVKISKGGPLGTAEFQYSLSRRGKLSKPMATAAQFKIPYTGVTLNFDGGEYSVNTTYEAKVDMELADVGELVNETQVLDIDLLATAPDGYDGKPITDYMLRVPDYKMAGPEPTEAYA